MSSAYFCFLFCSNPPAKINRLDLGLLETVLPDGGVGGSAILTEVNQDVPKTGLVENVWQ